MDQFLMLYHASLFLKYDFALFVRNLDHYVLLEKNGLDGLDFSTQ